MKLIKITIIGFTLGLMMSGCWHDENSNEEAMSCNESGEHDFIGCWVTLECSQFTDSNGMLIESWGRAMYTFSAEGDVTPEIFFYEDSNCITEKDFGEAKKPGPPPGEYLFVENYTTSEGLNGSRIKFYNGPPELPSGTEKSYIDVSLVITSENQLCASATLKMTSLTYIGSSTESQDIDYDSCLNRGVLP
ncbi:MAG: hypothetical protein OEZ58_05755 [Gammaproteobacteria bacterium]|nr:hypothetical protein [Gammaproteobacteria bacterium]